MVGLLHKTELWDKKINLYTLRLKILIQVSPKGNVQTKADVEEKAKDSTPF